METKYKRPSTSQAGRSVHIDDIKLSVDHGEPALSPLTPSQPNRQLPTPSVSSPFGLSGPCPTETVSCLGVTPGYQPVQNRASVYLRELPHMVNLVQPAHLREPCSNRRDEFAASLNTPPPKWVGAITSRQSAFDDIRGSHTMRSPIPKAYPGLTSRLIVKAQRYRTTSH